MPAPPVGLDITPSALIAVALKKKGRGYAVTRRAIAPLPHGIVSDGEVHDVEKLAEAIREFWVSAELKDKTVSVGVANQRCILRVLDLPRIKRRKELKEAISFEVSDNLPIPIEDAIWDFHSLDVYKDETTGIDRQRHVVVMVYRESVERYRDAIALAGLKLRRIDLSAFALMRSGLASLIGDPNLEPALEGEPNPAVAICDIGPTSTNLVVARNGICELNRLVSFGTSHFSQTLGEQFGWSTEDAERVKLEAGVLPLGGIESPSDPYSDTRRVMQYVADQLAAELRTSFDYYSHNCDNVNRIARVVLAGEGALLRGIEERFAAELGVPVSILDASPRLDVASTDELGANHAHYATALGLAMEDAA